MNQSDQFGVFVISPAAILTIVFLFAACTDGPLKPEDPIDIISGTYELEGIQINERYCLVGCIPERYGDVMFSDTLHISFSVEVKVIENRQDTLLFSGLEGADKYIRQLDSNRRVTNPNCKGTSHVSDCTYAQLHQGRLVFDLLTPGGWYTGEGKLGGGELTLKSNYFYRGLSVDYDLTGKKSNLTNHQ